MKNVADIYPLSPMQETMLLHAISRPGDDVLFNQFVYEINGDLDQSAMRGAWQALVDRHAILRSAFVWEDVKQPLQVVRISVDLPYRQYDWRQKGGAERDTALEALLDADRESGFALGEAPLTRLCVIRMDENRHVMVWSSHHLLVDRWCLGTLFTELAELYNASRSGRAPQLNEARPYRDYIGWIARQDDNAGRQFWHHRLAGMREPVPLTTWCGKIDQPRERQATLTLDDDVRAGLTALSRRLGVTPSTFLQGAWALTINRITGRQDGAFGIVTSGRPPDLPHVEGIVGTFINNLPVRMRMPRQMTMQSWLKALQAEQQARMPFEHVSPTDIDLIAGSAPGSRLFDNLFLWLAGEALPQFDGISLRAVSGDMSTAVPLTLSVSENDELALELRCQAGVDTVMPFDDILPCLLNVMQGLLAADPAGPLADLPGFRLDAEEPDDIPAPDSKEIAVAAASGGGVSPASEAVPGGREAADYETIRDLMTGAWQEVLGKVHVDADDNFFDIGGNSILAAQLHALAERRVGKRIPMLALFKAPTIRDMARTLANDEWPLSGQVITPLRTQGTLPPLFCISSPEVNSVGYALLAQHLNHERPVYVLQAPPQSGTVTKISPKALPELASTYIAAMREVQEAGPYHLLGMCTGSHLAHRIAVQLEAEGQAVPFVGIVNTWALNTISKFYYVQRVINRLRYYRGRLRELARQKPSEQLAVLSQVAARRFSRAAQAVAPVSGFGDGATTTPSPVSDASQRDEWIEDVGWATGDNDAPKFGGTVTVFRLRRQSWWRIRDRGLGWGLHADHVDIIDCPGDSHLTILRNPNVGSLAERLQASLVDMTH